MVVTVTRSKSGRRSPEDVHFDRKLPKKFPYC